MNDFMSDKLEMNPSDAYDGGGGYGQESDFQYKTSVEKIMKRWLSIMPLVLAGCATAPADNPNEYMVGTWSGAYVEKGYVSYGEKTYFDDGSSCGFIFSIGAGGIEFSAYRSQWYIEGDLLVSEVMKSNDSDIPPGRVIKDKIVDMDDTVLTLQGIESGGMTYRYKLKEDRGRTICEFSK